MRGGEKVVEQLCRIFPSADIHTLLWIKGEVSPEIEKHRITTSFLQKCPLIEKKYRQYLPLMPSAIESMKLEGYDIVISSSACVAKGVKVDRSVPHICYCHTPMRYIWDQYEEYFGGDRANVTTRLAMKLARPFLQKWDLSSSSRVNHFIANSNNVRERINRLYKRESEVIYPPVDIQGYPQPFDGGYYLMVTALVPYKRTDLAIQAFNESGRPLKIVGSGPELGSLKKIAKGNIEFCGWVDDSSMKQYYAGCKALIFPQDEDFGITAVEAQSAGKPVVAFGKGGALETVADGKTGVFFYEANPSALNNSIEQLNRMDIDIATIKQNAVRFSEERFSSEIIASVKRVYSAWHMSKKC
jgi:glycosyltransferase involved in cell wall biosynthesis